MAKYSIGEKVLLRSKSTPEKNGIYVIIDRWCNSLNADHEDDGTAYSIGAIGRNGKDDWYESALRPLPKHKPATESFTKMMGRLTGRHIEI